jgi:hypothetical protein
MQDSDAAGIALLSSPSAEDEGVQLSSLNADEGGSAAGSAAEPAAPFQSRLQTVASIVNTMMGTTILALPFGMAQSGIAVGLGITALLGAVSCATCLIVVERGLAAGHDDFSGSVEAFLGRRVQLLAWGFSVAIILGASIVYHILMQETLYALVATGLTAAGKSSAGWSRVYAALVPLIIYPVCNLKDLSALVRFNSVGFLFLWYTIIFICYHGIHVLMGGQGGSAAPAVAVATLPAGAPAFLPNGSLQVVTVGAPVFAGLGGMVSVPSTEGQCAALSLGSSLTLTHTSTLPPCQSLCR